jgi:TetR/AcrR family transcriptional repressor of nem operon
MRVSKAQAEANRARIVVAASSLFRERGYDGVGVVELMAAAGLTHGGFYGHFQSKVDLMAEAAAFSFSQSAAGAEGVGVDEFFRYYLSREHRDARAEGCTMPALCGDAARQPEAIKATFAAGVEGLLVKLASALPESGNEDGNRVRARTIDMVARAVGAIVLSRACPDESPLADEIVEACRLELLRGLSTPANN